MSSKKIIGVIEKAQVSFRSIQVIDVDGNARIVSYGDNIYEGESIVSDDSTAIVEIKFDGLSELVTYEGVFKVLADASVIEEIEESESVVDDDIDFDNMETAAGEEGVDASSNFIVSDSQNIENQIRDVDKSEPYNFITPNQSINLNFNEFNIQNEVVFTPSTTDILNAFVEDIKESLNNFETTQDFETLNTTLDTLFNEIHTELDSKIELESELENLFNQVGLDTDLIDATSRESFVNNLVSDDEILAKPSAFSDETIDLNTLISNNIPTSENVIKVDTTQDTTVILENILDTQNNEELLIMIEEENQDTTILNEEMDVSDIKNNHNIEYESINSEDTLFIAIEDTIQID